MNDDDDEFITLMNSTSTQHSEMTNGQTTTTGFVVHYKQEPNTPFHSVKVKGSHVNE